MPEKIKNVFAVATEAAKKAGYKSFKEGTPGKEKRGEIAEAIKREMKKMQLEKALPIWALPDPGSHGKLVRPKKEIKKEPPSDMGSSTNKPYVDADEHFDAFAKFMKKEFDVDLEKIDFNRMYPYGSPKSPTGSKAAEKEAEKNISRALGRK